MDWKNLYSKNSIPMATRAIGSTVSGVDRLLRKVEPWGVMIAAVGLAFTAYSAWLTLEGRIFARTVASWELLAIDKPGNNSKAAALGHINRQIGLFCWWGDRCLKILKKREPLSWLDLSPSDGVEHGAYLRRVDLNWALLHKANLSKALLTYADLRRAQMKESILTGARLVGADLRRTDFEKADLRNVNFTNAKIDETDFKDADLSGAEELTQEMLDRACGNEGTKLPIGLTIPHCDRVEWYEDVKLERNRSWIVDSKR
ncbi:MAG: pentapeptide repeat-containing protein [Pseudomonadota bacterium]